MHSHIYTQDTLIEQQPLIQTLSARKLPTLSAFIDGRGLHCPMPLLKLKLALRQAENAIYLVATDSNSQADIGAFCQKHGHGITIWHDTYTHFLVTKIPSIS